MALRNTATKRPPAGGGNTAGRRPETGCSIGASPDCGILVIGGGISGLCLARAVLCLPCRGHGPRPHVVVLEQTDQPKEGQHETGTIDLTQRAVMVLRELDVDLPCVRDAAGHGGDSNTNHSGGSAATVGVSRSDLVAALRASLPPGTLRFNCDCIAVKAASFSSSSSAAAAAAAASPDDEAAGTPLPALSSSSALLTAVVRDPRTGQTSSLPERFGWAVAADGLVSRSRELVSSSSSSSSSSHSGAVAAATAALLRHRLLAIGDAARVFRGEADFGVRRVRRGASDAIWQARDLAALLLLRRRDQQLPSSSSSFAPGTRENEDEDEEGEDDEEGAIAALRAYTMAAALSRNRLERAVPMLLVLLALLAYYWWRWRWR
jgi:2-polyprenyl-6-methoxyphenol hydroxylase-like FAD-dependent oxidoreductase